MAIPQISGLLRRCAPALLGVAIAAHILSTTSTARAQQEPIGPATTAPVEQARTPSEQSDATGGAYTTPTLHFIPAAAVPVWNVRVITSLAIQAPTVPDRLAVNGGSLGFQPGLGGELGLPLGFTLGAGTNWVGGDVSPTPVSGGLSPYFQARYRIYGADRGFLLGTSFTYKFVGFQGDPGELEWALSGQYRAERYEFGIEGVAGKDQRSALPFYLEWVSVGGSRSAYFGP